MNRVIVTYGLISGAVLSAMLVLSAMVMKNVGMERTEYVGYASMLLGSGILFLGVRAYRDTLPAASVRFRALVKGGLLILLISTICYVITWDITMRTIMPDFAERYAAMLVDKARAAGADSAAIVAKQAEMAEFGAMYRNPLMRAALTFLEPLPIGLAIVLLSAWGLSRQARARVSTEGIPVS